MTKVSNSCTDAIDTDLTVATRAPVGFNRVTGPEVGIFFRPEDAHMSRRKIYLKPNNTPEGLAAWEKQSQATHDEVDRTGEAKLILGMRGLRQGTEDFKKAFAAWERGDLVLPSLADALGMPKKNNQDHGGTARGEVARVELAAETEHRLQRMRDQARSGVRLEPAPPIIKLER